MNINSSVCFIFNMNEVSKITSFRLIHSDLFLFAYAWLLVHDIVVYYSAPCDPVPVISVLEVHVRVTSSLVHISLASTR